MVPLIPLALGLAQFAPSIARWVAGDRAGEVAQQVVDVANTVTGNAADPIAALRANPELQAQFVQQWTQLELALFQEETRRLQEVAATMRAEASSSDPYVRQWRPYWGYTAARVWMIEGLAIVGAVAGATACALLGRPDDAVALLSGLAQLMDALSESWSVALMVLGVAVYARTRDKKGASGVPMPGLAGVLGQFLQGRRK